MALWISFRCAECPPELPSRKPLGCRYLTCASQDIEPSSVPSFLLKLSNDDELVFTFTFIIRQETNGSVSDTQLNGLTYVYASSSKEVENLVTREFHADPNLHKNANVELVGDYTTGGSSSVSFEWSWKWKPPKGVEDRGGGWRNACSVSLTGEQRQTPYGN